MAPELEAIYQSDLIVATFSLASFFNTPSDYSFAIPFHDSSLARRMILQKAHLDLFSYFLIR
jgi:hypothetical protein